MKLIGFKDQANNPASTAEVAETLHLMSKKWPKILDIPAIPAIS